MSTSRIEIFEQMLAGDPSNTMVMFGLAKEYEKAGDETKLIETLERYLAVADDEGNARRHRRNVGWRCRVFIFGHTICFGLPG